VIKTSKVVPHRYDITSELIITDDKEKAAEALLTVIENGEVKGTVASSNPAPAPFLP